MSLDDREWRREEIRAERRAKMAKEHNTGLTVDQFLKRQRTKSTRKGFVSAFDVLVYVIGGLAVIALVKYLA